jgi:membrane-bound metal-dependent hydrolase YbcI (DUF457 family)
MPNYKGHLVGGVVAYCVMLFAIIGCMPSLMTASEWLLFTLAGALFPDVDIKSKGQKYFYYVIFALFVLLACKGWLYHLSCFSFLAITPMLARHRGIFHSAWFVIVLPLIVWMAISMLFPALSRPFFLNTLFFITGALSHLFLDRSFSRMPFKRYRR